MTSVEEITKNINEMEYITAEIIGELKPSFYKLKDGTIIRVLININHIVADPEDGQKFSINSSNSIVAYVAKENRHPELHKQFGASDTQSKIIDEDMEPETLREDFSTYALSNGMTVSIKPVVGQVSKTQLYTIDGEPVYMVNPIPVIKTKKNE